MSRADGARGEAVAAEYLKKKGYRIIKRNYHAGIHGEIDIIAEDGPYIVFAEVKLRSDTPVQRRFGRPSDSINSKKKKALYAAANNYMNRYAVTLSPRIDVIELLTEKDEESGFIAISINHIIDAFV